MEGSDLPPIPCRVYRAPFSDILSSKPKTTCRFCLHKFIDNLFTGFVLQFFVDR